VHRSKPFSSIPKAIPSDVTCAFPRTRRYWNGGTVEVKFKFEIAPSGKPDAFAAYITGELHRK
jgi:hypothetical protein